MKTLKRIFAAMLVLMLVFAFCACNTPDQPDNPDTPAHTCESKCDECGKCTDAACTESACADKCAGHTPAHECESKCDVCGKCTDAACTESACADKCAGHALVAENGVLFATYTNNMRADGTTEPVISVDGQIAILPAGKAMGDINCKYYKYTGEESIDHLVGYPVTYYLDGKEIAKVEIRGTEFVDYAGNYKINPDEKTYTNATSGELLPLDAEAFAEENWKQNTYYNRGFLYGDAFNPFTSSYANTNSDVPMIFVDTDKDGDYDFIKLVLAVNALQLNSIEGNICVPGSKSDAGINGSFGCATWTGWINGTAQFQFTCAPGVTVKEGDRVNAEIRVNLNSTTVGYQSLMVELYVTGVCEMKTGEFTNIQANDWKDITCDVDGTPMAWSNAASNGKAADGTDGALSGRSLMTADNNGKKFNYWVDAIGTIVYAELIG